MKKVASLGIALLMVTTVMTGFGEEAQAGGWRWGWAVGAGIVAGLALSHYYRHGYYPYRYGYGYYPYGYGYSYYPSYSYYGGPGWYHRRWYRWHHWRHW